MSINSVNVSGHITGNFDLRATPAGTSVLEFCVVVDERRRDQKTGEWSNYANFVNCVMFGTRAAALHKILEKGMKVFVSGHLRYEQWEKDGQKRSNIRVIVEDVDVMGPRNGAQAQNNTTQGNYTSQTQNAPQKASQGPTEYEYANDYYQDEIPF